MPARQTCKFLICCSHMLLLCAEESAVLEIKGEVTHPLSVSACTDAQVVMPHWLAEALS